MPSDSEVPTQAQFREELIEAMARALCAWNGLTWDEARRPTTADGDTEAAEYASMAEDALDAALSFRSSDVCLTCDGTGVVITTTVSGRLPTVCPICCSDGRVPRESPRLAVVGEQVGWQYAHDRNGPLVNLHQAEACDDTVPVFTLLPEGEHQ